MAKLHHCFPEKKIKNVIFGFNLGNSSALKTSKKHKDKASF
jgi:hypothetical protein